MRDLRAAIADAMPVEALGMRVGEGVFSEARLVLPASLHRLLRTQANQQNVNVSSLCYLAWAQVIARCSACYRRVAFGAVLPSGTPLDNACGAKAMAALAVFPMRVDLDDLGVAACLRQVDVRLSELSLHASRYSPDPTQADALAMPFVAVLQYRQRGLVADGEQPHIHPQQAHAPLALSVDDSEQALTLVARTHSPIDPQRICAYMAQTLTHIAEALERNPDLPARQLPILPATERTQLLETWNATAAPYPREQCFHRLFEAHAARAPDAMAVAQATQALSYGELNARANRLAHRLIELGVHVDERVAICVARSVDMVVSVLAVLKAGGAYVPLDPAYPGERLLRILSDAAPTLVLADATGRTALGDVLTAHTVLDPAEPLEQSSDNPQVTGLTASNLAYLIYTSGSTGAPKGVMVEHRGWCNLVRAQTLSFDVQSSSRVLQFASAGFDASVWEIGMALGHGATLDLAPDSVRHDIHALWNYLGERGITHATLPPALFQNTATLPPLPQSRLTALILAGEAPGAALLHTLSEHSAVFNAYGPTETTVCATVWRYDGKPETTVSIGRPLINTRCYVLDDEQQLVPLGAIGELYVGGAGVARGYLHRPELTAERFMPDPFVHADGDTDARMYKTGDRVRYLPDGNLLFLGRNDQQVKLRGFRIELGEIEARLLDHARVREAVVIAREDKPGSTQLVGYVVLHAQADADRHAEQETRQVDEWQDVYQQFYQQPVEFAFGENFSGWNSSYNGKPIPLDEMRAWRQATVARIEQLNPRRILEIGVGSGLLLAPLIERCEAYWALDFSAAAIEALRAHMAARPADAAKVKLHHQAAHDIDGLPASYFDTIIINSVAQHFPSAGYLIDVIRKAMTRLVPGGALFLGDNRNLHLLRSFVTAVQLHQATADIDAEELRRRVQQNLLAEKQLLLAPEFFALLPSLVPAIGAVDIQLKRDDSLNELTRYRYDVVLRKASSDAVSMASMAARAWQSLAGLSDLQRYLSEARPACERITGIPNARLSAEYAASQTLHAGGTLEQVRACLRAPAAGVAPDALHALGEALGYRVLTTYASTDSAQFDAIFIDAGVLPAAATLTDLYVPPASTGSLASYANDPGNFDQLAELRNHLTQSLPTYMVPAAIVQVDAMPLTSSGKLDRKALPAPEFVGARYQAPRTEAETLLCRLFAEVLGLPRVGADDHFFELGGHSLLAVRLLSRIQQSFGVDVPLTVLFAQPRLSELAATIEQQQQTGESARPPIPVIARARALPLSFAQQRLWFLAQLDGATTNYHVPLSLHLEGDLDRDALRHALDRVYARHESLRTIFVTVDGQPQVQILPVGTVPWSERDLRDVPASAHATALQTAMATPFVLSAGPLLRAHLFRTGPHSHVLLLMVHHIVCDGWSLDVLLDELGALYTAFLTGQPDPLAPLPIQYPDYAAWQRTWFSEARLRGQAEYWRQQLTDAPVLLELPTDRPRPAQQNFTGAAIALELDAHLTEALKQLAQRHGATVYMVVLAAWAVVLSRLSGQRDLVIGTPTAGRGQQETEALIGFFVNTLALRLDLSDTPSVAELLAQVRARVLAAQDHQDVPFEQVVEIVQPPRRLDHTPLFQTMLAWQADHHVRQWPQLRVDSAPLSNRTAHFDLELVLGMRDERIAGTFGYATALFDESTIERYRDYLTTTLRAMVADAAQHVLRLPLLGAAERTRLLETWNATDAPYPHEQCIHQLFEAQVARSADAIAVVSETQSLSYGELNARANRLAHRLIDLGVRADTRVAICVERSVDMVIGLLAILKAGGAYVPLDPAYPGERLQYMLADSQPSVVLIDTTGEQALASQHSAPQHVRLHLHNDAAQWQSQPDRNPDPATQGLRPHHLVYVIYTSGSTGRPKGVMNAHRGVVNRIHWMQQAYGLDAQDVVLQKTPFSFDVSAWEFFWPLTTGARLVMARPDGHKDPLYLAGVIRDAAVTTLHFVPSMLQTFLGEPETAAHCDSLARVICSGEALPAALARSFYQTLPHARLHNLYGPTEAAIDVTAWACLPDDPRTSVPIGRPIANTQIYILDDDLQPVPTGAAGELHIGGVGVARGYLHRPTLTAERFVPDPFAPAHVDGAARLYKTGDMARYTSDGALIYLGRNDDQIKLRGFRIELGEIESALSEHALVRETAVVLRRGEHRLVAYIVPAADAPADLAAVLRSDLAGRLPDYMVPAAFVMMQKLPLSPSGKLDRKALPAPQTGDLVHAAYEAPVGSAETALAAIWQELLHVEQISRHDSFFALGGHSLLAVTLIERLRRRGLSLAIRDLFRAPTLADLARAVGRHHDVAIPANRITAQTTRITPELLPLIDLAQDDIDRIVASVPGGVANIQDIYALSPLQDGILFHHLLSTAGDPYLLFDQRIVADRATLDRYLAAVQHVVDRHDMLRTAFVWDGLSAPAQVVWRRASLSIAEFEFDPNLGPIAEQLAQRCDPRQHSIDLTQAPLLHFAIARNDDGRWLLLMLLHHLIGDHATLDVMHDEVQAFLAGRGDTLPPAQPFRQLIAQARMGTSPSEHKRFFQTMLGEIDEPTLPFGLTEVHRDGTQVREASRALPDALNTRLRAQARQLGVSLACLCHVAWALVLARASGQRRVVFGTVLFGRMQASESIERAMGLFINTLPIRLDVDGAGVAQSVRSAHRMLAELLEHEHASLALAQRCSGVPAGTPLFSAMLNYRHNMPSADPSPEHAASDTFAQVEYLGGHERTNYPLVLSVEDSGSALGLTAQIQSPFEPQRICDYMAQALSQLVEALEHSPDLPARQLEILPAAERTQLLESWNATAAPYPSEQCFHYLFEAQAARAPDAIAVVHGTQTLSYAELNSRANRLAHWLIAQGIGPEVRVAICVERSPAMVIGVLAVLKAGGAYVPLDAAYPGERLLRILDDAEPTLVLADAAGRAALGKNAAAHRVLDPNDALEHGSDAQASHNPRIAGLTASNLAYLIYTSGSTGTPKGVMVEHRSWCNLVGAQTATFDIRPSSRVLQFASLGFDASVSEIGTALGYGASLDLPPDNVRHDVEALWNYLEAHAITHATLPPALFQSTTSLPRLPHSRLSALIVGGEAPSATLMHMLSEHALVLNVYGPTEITVCSSLWCYDDRPDAPVSLGRPISNMRYYVLDEHRQPVPLGAIGELYIGGVGVARGYLNRPDLTAERFLPDPFAPSNGDSEARMYKSGDLVRYLPDEKLVYLGRNDQQVKLRGFRIELGEIEARLLEHSRVREAVVMAREDTPGLKQLVAYILPATDNPDDRAVDLATALRATLARQLPDYMVPVAFVAVPKFPLTPSCKLDRKALPAPGVDALVHAAYEAPHGNTETLLASLWQTLLSVPRVGADDNFFELGGHSLLAVRLLSRIRQAFGVELPLKTLFAQPRLGELAATIEQQQQAGESARPPIKALAREGALPLSFAQQRLWFLAQLDGATTNYHIPLTLRLDGALDRDALRRAVDRVYARHESLRTIFVALDGQPQVHILPVGAVPWSERDLRDVPESAHATELQTAMATPFVLSAGPLLRAHLFRTGEQSHLLLLMVHHIVCDGWSLDVWLDELGALYAAYHTGQPDPLAPLPIQYPDYAAWQRTWFSEARLRSQADYWRQQLADAPVLLDLPTDRPRPPQQSFAGATVELELDASLTEALKQLAQRHGATVFMVVMAAWAVVLSRLSGQRDLVIGTPTAGRGQQETEALIGFFVNTLAVRIDLTAAPSVAELLAQVRAHVLAAQDHQDLPFEQVVEMVQPQRRLDHTPLFQTMFAWQADQHARQWAQLRVASTPLTNRTARFDLELVLGPHDERIAGMLSYATALFDESTIERYRDYLTTTLQAMAADAAQPVLRLPLLSAAERTQLLQTWNATDAPYPREQCIHWQFEAQAARTPDAMALVHEAQSLRYAELNVHANRLAHALIAQGIGPDKRVAICVERSPAMVISVLAVLKAGGAYVPLDPAYPGARLTTILTDAEPSLVLADAVGRQALGESAAAHCVLDPNDVIDHASQEQPSHNPQISGLTASDLAYLIYTSGSTGTPKGVMVEHRQLAASTLARRSVYNNGTDSRFLLLSSLAFDSSVAGVFGTLSHGGCLVLPSLATAQNPVALAALMREQRITTLLCVPSLAAVLLPELRSEPTTALREWIVAGEPCPANLVDAIAAWSREVTLYNEYGPTEATVWTTVHRCRAGENPVPIGRPIAHARCYVLDDDRQPVPLGATGELYIGGAGVARGYLHRPELTAERFLPDPFVGDADARMYKTGDLVRYLPDGNLLFLGRNDQQVKLRGFRIELGEIEARLREHPRVRDAVVIARDDTPGLQQLVAYVIPVGDSQDDLAVALRTQLAHQLPDYMLPTAFFALAYFPLTPNGKLDRKALPVPGAEALVHAVYEAPHGNTETTLAALWQALLNVERVGRQDHFFELGGHSLLAVRLLSRVQQSFGVDLPLTVLFAQPRLSELATTIEQQQQAGESARPPIQAIAREAALPLSFAQQRLWFLAQLDGANSNYHIPLILNLRGDLDEPALRRSLDALYARHAGLHSVFVPQDGEPHVVLLPATNGWPWQARDMRGTDDAQLTPVVLEEIRKPFDLREGALVRALLLQRDTSEHRLVLVQHHIVSDGWSIGLLCDELSALYAAFHAGQPDPLAPLPIQYPDYAAWQREWLSGDRLRRQADYWRHQLSDAPVLLTLPTDRPRPPRQSFDGAFLPVTLDAALTHALKRLSQQHGTTLFVTVMAAWAAVLSRLSGQDDLVIGTPSANRGQRQIEGLIGFFVNTLALRVDLSGEPSVADVLTQVHRTALAAQDHQDLPFEQVVEIVQPPRRLDHTPLFQVMFGWQSNEQGTLALPGLDVRVVEPPIDAVRFDLELHLYEHDGCIEGVLAYATALFDAATVARHRGYLVAMLRAMVIDTAQTAAAIDVLTDEERDSLLDRHRDEARAPVPQLCIHQKFEAQARQQPHAVALCHAGQTLTYGELNRRANRLAHRLIELGVRPDDRVAICVERGFAMVIGLLGILKAGGAYVPLDPAYPASRLTQMLSDATPALVLADAAGRHAVDAQVLEQQPLIDLDAFDAHAEAWPDTDPAPQSLGLGPDHLAYVIYTSGSTGTPKGVAMPHRALVNLVDWHGSHWPALRTLQFAALSFDVAFQEIFSTLCSGTTLVLIAAQERLQMQRLLDIVVRQRVQRLFLPYIAAQGLAEAVSALDEAKLPGLHGLREIIVAGEQLRLTPPLQRMFQRLPQCRLHNHYGPTETHLASAYLLGSDMSNEPSHVPIGKAIDHVQLYVVDRYGHLVPFGATGELYIGGAGVARGYLHRPELTAERFLRDPFAQAHGDLEARMYKTGDLVRYLPDGNLTFLGRNDQQVKLRGFRIELGEIEARLLEHARVREAVVIAREDTPGLKQLVAYVVPLGESPDDLAAALRTQLARQLPDYMVPAAFVALSKFPLTPNGKLDRKALPIPGADALVHAVYEAPQGNTETGLAALWQTLLNVERVGRQDHFFELGGHSLLAVRLLSRIQQSFGVDVPLTVLFDQPRLSELAAAIEHQQQAGESARPPIQPLPRDGALPLSFAQQRLWFLAQLDGAQSNYHLPLALRLRGELDVTALRRSLDRLYARHESLRMVFDADAGQPHARLLPAQGMPWREHDLRNAADVDAEQHALMIDNASAPFDLDTGPLVRTQLLRLQDRHYLLLLTQHHIISDGWSLEVLLRELGQLYTAFHAGQPDPLAPLPVQYPDYAAWQREWLSGERLRRQADYWRDQLGDAPVLLSLPTDRPRPARQSFDGAFLPVTLDAALTQALQRLSQQHGTTLFVTLMAAWAAVLSRLSGQDDLVIGTPSANRGQRQIESLIGFFVNTLALRVNLSGEPSVADLLTQMRTTALAAQDHQDLPFEQVVELVQPPRRLDHTPLFQVMFTWQSMADIAPTLPGLTVEPAEAPLDTVKYDLKLTLYEQAGRIVGGFSYATALFDATTIERQRGYLLTMLTAMSVDAAQSTSRIPLLGAAERKLLLHDWNRTTADYPRELCLHALFEAQAQRTPRAAAVIDTRRTLDYDELNAEANRIAHHLRASGVGPDDRVALCAERSVEMVAGLLGILKAGGAYVPLDPIYAGPRLARILSDAGAKAVLVDAAGLQALGPDALAGHTVLDLQRSDAAWRGQPASNPRVPGLTSRHLAYVIYTSGSTGTPKGVMVEHRSVVNFWHALGRSTHRRCAAGSRTALNASFAFDMSVKGWSQLLSGHALYLIPQEVRASGTAMLRFLERHAIDAFDATPSQLEGMIEAGLLRNAPQRPRSVLLGGEPISPSLWRTLQACRFTEFHNMYGPTECTVDATAGLIGNDDDTPNIGKAMPNARIYLLDRHGEPVPLGSVGEMYIGGDGVARGYLQQPSLTAERFLPDPFVGTADARMYRTGDLARYLPDGRLVFIGRNDHQVKIRGFRIELGEIEARLIEHPLVRACAVIAREDAPGQSRLVAYVTTGTDDIPDDGLPGVLRTHLTACLPDYMVPAAFVALPSLPLTANGKLNRNGLPLPADSDFARGTHAEPEGETEIALAQLWRDILRIERISRHDHFFELGGHSLLAVQLANRMQTRFGVDGMVRDVFAAPILKDLAARIFETEAPVAAVSSLDREAALDPAINAHGSAAPAQPPKAVLLTGASGFLGLFLLCSLLKRSDADVYCLIRAPSVDAGRQRLEENLARLGLRDDYLPQRVTIVPGDLSQPLLGLQAAAFQTLADGVDAIYHNGAWVNFLHSYQTLKPTNVLGTQEILRLAATGKPKLVHYVSTMSVAPFGAAVMGDDEATEDNQQELRERWQHLSSGYVQSKWVAERMLRIAAQRGLPVTVYRPSHICGSSVSGAGNASDSWNLFIDACLELGQVPHGDAPINMLPVNDVSDYIVALSSRHEAIGHSYNLFHPHASSMRQLVDSMLAMPELSLRQIPYGEWLAQCIAHPATRGLAAIMPSELPEHGQNGNNTDDTPDNALAMLIEEGYRCPAIGPSLLRKYVHWRLAERAK